MIFSMCIYIYIYNNYKSEFMKLKYKLFYKRKSLLLIVNILINKIHFFIRLIHILL